MQFTFITEMAPACGIGRSRGCSHEVMLGELAGTLHFLYVNDSDVRAASEQHNGTKRALEVRHLVMIALGGVIGSAFC